VDELQALYKHRVEQHVVEYKRTFEETLPAKLEDCMLCPLPKEAQAEL